MLPRSHCTTALLGLGLSLTACGTGPNDRRDSVQYQFALAAFGADTTPERIRSYDCVVSGFFQVSIPVQPDSTVHFPVTVNRSLQELRGVHYEQTRADSTVSEAVLGYTGLASDSLTFTLEAGPYAVTLGPGGPVPSEPGEYAGPWTCGVEVPLAYDSTLGVYGYDPNLQIQGTWRVSELRTIE